MSRHLDKNLSICIIDDFKDFFEKILSWRHVTDIRYLITLDMIKGIQHIAVLKFIEKRAQLTIRITILYHGSGTYCLSKSLFFEY